MRNYRVTSYTTGTEAGGVLRSVNVKAYSYDEARRRSGVSGAVVGVKAL